jgi:hypothetical protein
VDSLPLLQAHALPTVVTPGIRMLRQQLATLSELQPLSQATQGSCVN